ncbi:hypothetical protein DUF1330 [Nocardia nova SH22a]|uniref:DUF1330 domain-containing protein n=1 Tax=Nocardia nova SH22a TaxID=1415166 RepID=W5T9M4_9NOCA|nr:DUF1330 domain-containing protein [Nocardia nova]AHH16035.1 hypothetical protein DUF1330 [Nocardia nova SH22a]
MPAYVIAHLLDAAPHPDIAEYIERLPGMFAPYGGRYLVHMTQHEVKEGDWPGSVVMIGFPGISEARSWWESPAYRAIAPLRSRHIDGDIIMVEGVPDGYEPTAAVAAMRKTLSGTASAERGGS